MKKLTSIVLVALATLSCSALDFKPQSFIAGGIRSITITNAAAAPLGGLTNIASWSYSAIDPAVTPGTNSIRLTWTNSSGLWVIPTNATVLGSTTGISWISPTNGAQVLADCALPTTSTGMMPLLFFGPGTNSVAGIPQGALDFSCISSITLQAKIYGDTSAANTLNLIFVGVPDGTNDAGSSLTVSAIPAFQWGITAAAGVTVVTTNLPLSRFVGMKSIRLRSGTITTTTAASIGVSLLGLTLNAQMP